MLAFGMDGMDGMDGHRPEWNALNVRPADASPEKPPKRRKVAIACDECRVRKTKCDGVQPVCGPCARRSDAGVQCTYGTGRQRRSGFSKDYVSSLETRIKDLERVGQSVGQSAHHSSLSTSFALPTNGSMTRAYDPIEVRSNSAAGPYAAPAPQFSPRSAPSSHPARSLSVSDEGYRNVYTPLATTPSSQEQPAREASTSHAMGLGLVAHSTAADPHSHASAGSGSGGPRPNVLQQIKTVVDAKVVSPEGRPSGEVLSKVQLSTLSSEPRQKANTADYVLPPRKTADALLDVYWRFVHPLYPFLDAYEVSRAYQKLWTGEPTEFDETLLMCTLNMMFALACQLSETIEPEQRGASADVFFRRAKDLLNFSLWEVGSMPLIQCLLVMGQYLQSTNSAHQCWIVIGLAMRNAQSLGLHLPKRDSQYQSPREKDLARRVWHGCVLMDRIVSMTFGRPVMITQKDADMVPLPTAIDDDFTNDDLRLSSMQTDSPPSVTLFFRKTLELHNIMTNILPSLLSPVNYDSLTDPYQFFFSGSVSGGIGNLFDLDQKLTNWDHGLPMYLRVGTREAFADDMKFRQSIVLRTRFLHIRMLLFRPILSRYCISPEAQTATSSTPLTSLGDLLPQRIALQCSILCVRTAQEAIDLIHRNIPTGDSCGSLPAWWYTILYTYTAATILIAARLQGSITAEVPEESITRSWRRALDILHKYQQYSTSTRRCIAALEILYDRASSTKDTPGSALGPGASATVAISSVPKDGVALLADAAESHGISNRPAMGYQPLSGILNAASGNENGNGSTSGSGSGSGNGEGGGAGLEDGGVVGNGIATKQSGMWFDSPSGSLSLGSVDLRDMSWLTSLPSSL